MFRLASCVLLLLIACGDDTTSPDSLADAGGSDVPGQDGFVPLDAPQSDTPAVDTGPVVDDGLLPVWSAFRVEGDAPDRVLFDTSEPMTGSSVDGIVVSLAEVAEIVFAEGATTGHYIRLEEPLTFWSNNTIRYEGGAVLTDLEGNAMAPFTLSYVDNLIPEPEAPESRFVTRDATGGGDGQSEASAWTLGEAFEAAEAGQTVWIRAGDYGHQVHEVYHRHGLVERPIKFVGYRETPGDIEDNYWGYEVPFDVDAMPTITCDDEDVDRSLTIGDSHHVIFRNIQWQHCKFAAWSFPNEGLPTSSNVIFDQVNGRDFGSEDHNYGSFITIEQYDASRTGSVGNTGFRVLDAVVMNYSMAAVALMGDGGNLIEGVRVYNDTELKPDYQVHVNGNNSIIRNTYIEIVNDYYSASTHGIGIRGGTRQNSEYNLIEHCEAVNLNESFYIRNVGCEYNVIKDSVARNNGAEGSYRNGVHLWGGAHHNTIERVSVFDTLAGIAFKDNEGEDDSDDLTMANDNLIRDCTFNNVRWGIHATQDSSEPAIGAIHRNRIVGCTFHNVGELFSLNDSDVQDMAFVNTNFSSIGAWFYQNRDEDFDVPPMDELTFEHCNFFEVEFEAPPGTGNISVDPGFVDADANDLRLQDDSALRGAGTTAADDVYDMERRERPSPPSIGAYE